MTDEGLSPRVYSDDIPLSKKELLSIIIYYAVILNYGVEGTICGPLPAAYHPDLLVLFYKFFIKDKQVKDLRVSKAGHFTPAFIIIFFKATFDNIIMNMRKEVANKFAHWTLNYQDMSEISENDLQKLELSLNEIEPKQTDQTFEINSVKDSMLFIRQIDFLSNFVKEEYKLSIVSEDDKFLFILKKLFLTNGWDFIDNYHEINSSLNFEIKINKIKILFSKPTNTLIKPKNNSIIFFGDVSGSKTKESTIEFYKKILNKLNKNDQCLLYAFSTIGKINFQKSPLFNLSRLASGKNLSIVELENNFSLVPIINFMYQLIERKQNLRYSK